MENKNPLRKKMEHLRIRGVPCIVKTKAERMDAHNVARSLGISIVTRKAVLNGGIEIHRVK